MHPVTPASRKNAFMLPRAVRVVLAGMALLPASPVLAATAPLSPPANSGTPAVHADAVAKALATRLPRTQVAKVDCSKVPGLCEVQAGANVFYVDPSARYLLIGRIYDMQTRQDLTSVRLLEINPDMMLGGAASARDGAGSAAATAAAGGTGTAVVDPGSGARAAAAPPSPTMPAKVSLANLPATGAIEWGGKGPTVTVFSDFHCGYCRMLHQTLVEMGAHVIERPISVLGTRAISDAVICSSDKAAALRRAYSDQDLPRTACDTSGLDANEAFARANGFSGTPVIVRGDGAVTLGYRPREFLETWLKGGA